jgi:hypothetical protein
MMGFGCSGASVWEEVTCRGRDLSCSNTVLWTHVCVHVCVHACACEYVNHQAGTHGLA